jgi:ubiquitin fusion degradation protein 1
MMTHLNLRNGDFITIKSKSVPVGRFVKIQPQTENFLEITNPRAVLENGLRNFACLTVGDMISLKYNQKIYQLKVLEAKPTDAICIIEVLFLVFSQKIG